MDAYAQLVADAQAAGCQRLVIAAAVVAHGRVLVLHSADAEFFGGIDELPSGVIENGRPFPTHSRALHEETGLRLAAIVRPLPSFDYRSVSGQRTRQLSFQVSVTKLGPIILSEHTEYAWVALDALSNTRLTPAVHTVLRTILAAHDVERS